jgi:hypothetical protein
MDSAFVGLLGVAIGSGLTWAKDAFPRLQERNRDTAHLGAVVSAQLDWFAEGCSDVAYDDGTVMGQFDATESRREQIDRPQLDITSSTLQWRVLPSELLDRILQFPNEARSLERRLSYEWDSDLPPYDDYFAERQYQYAKLGIRALKLSTDLRVHAKLPGQSEGSRRNESNLRARVFDWDVTRQRVAEDKQASWGLLGGAHSS